MAIDPSVWFDYIRARWTTTSFNRRATRCQGRSRVRSNRGTGECVRHTLPYRFYPRFNSSTKPRWFRSKGQISERSRYQAQNQVPYLYISLKDQNRCRFGDMRRSWTWNVSQNWNLCLEDVRGHRDIASPAPVIRELNSGKYDCTRD